MNENTSGFTLLEVMFSIILIPIVFIGLTQGLVNSRKNLIIARQSTVASELAENELEAHKADLPDSNEHTTETRPVEGFSFEQTTTITKKESTTDGGLDYDNYHVKIELDNDLISPVIMETLVQCAPD